MYKNNFFKLAGMLKSGDTKTISYQLAKKYEHLVDLILNVIKHHPKAFEGVNLEEASLSELLDITERYLENLYNPNKKKRKLLSFCTANSDSFSFSELFIILVFLIGTKKIKLRKTSCLTKDKMVYLIKNQIIETEEIKEKSELYKTLKDNFIVAIVKGFDEISLPTLNKRKNKISSV